MISSDMEEILGNSDRVAVMHEGRITGCSRAGMHSGKHYAIGDSVMRKELGIFTLLVALCVVVALKNPQFLSAANIQNMARLIGTFGIFSIGVGIVIITGGIDLSWDQSLRCLAFFCR
jgi:predicted ABC-type sugar transport system permease subunit